MLCAALSSCVPASDSSEVLTSQLAAPEAPAEPTARTLAAEATPVSAEGGDAAAPFCSIGGGCGCGEEAGEAPIDPLEWIAKLEDAAARETELGWHAKLSEAQFRVLRMKGTEEELNKFRVGHDTFIVVQSTLTPVADAAEVARRFGGRPVPNELKAFTANNIVSEFWFERPFRKGAKTGNEFETMWVEATTLRTEHPLPCLLNRARVVDCEAVERSPLDNAVKQMEDKNGELQGIITAIQKMPQNYNMLTMALNGTIDAAVQGGVENYRRLFFKDEYLLANPENAETVGQLKKLIGTQNQILEAGLAVHASIIPGNVRPLHDHLEQTLEGAKEKHRADASAPAIDPALLAKALADKLAARAKAEAEEAAAAAKAADAPPAPLPRRSSQPAVAPDSPATAISPTRPQPAMSEGAVPLRPKVAKPALPRVVSHNPFSAELKQQTKAANPFEEELRSKLPAKSEPLPPAAAPRPPAAEAAPPPLPTVPKPRGNPFANATRSASAGDVAAAPPRPVSRKPALGSPRNPFEQPSASAGDAAPPARPVSQKPALDGGGRSAGSKA